MSSNQELQALLEIIEQKGREILNNIDTTDTVKTKTNGREGNAARSYYSVSKILLEVEKLNDARGKAGEGEIAQALTRHLGDNSKMLRLPMPYAGIRKQIAERERHFKNRKNMAMPTQDDINAILDLLQKVISMLVMAFAAYKTGKEALSSQKQKPDANTTDKKQTKKRKVKTKSATNDDKSNDNNTK